MISEIYIVDSYPSSGYEDSDTMCAFFSHRDHEIVVVGDIFVRGFIQLHFWENSERYSSSHQINLAYGQT